MRYFSIITPLSLLILAGCATQPMANVPTSDFQPGGTYQIEVYVLAPGDSIAKVCYKFQIRIRDFEALNPDLDPRHLSIGQSVKVYQRLKD